MILAEQSFFLLGGGLVVVVCLGKGGRPKGTKIKFFQGVAKNFSTKRRKYQPLITIRRGPLLLKNDCSPSMTRVPVAKP